MKQIKNTVNAVLITLVVIAHILFVLWLLSKAIGWIK